VCTQSDKQCTFAWVLPNPKMCASSKRTKSCEMNFYYRGQIELLKQVLFDLIHPLLEPFVENFCCPKIHGDEEINQ
jgi:hypothetical protein